MEVLERIMTSDKLVEMLNTAIDSYGNRPVFVEINGHRYIINDLSFTSHGKDFTLILNDVN